MIEYASCLTTIDIFEFDLSFYKRIQSRHSLLTSTMGSAPSFGSSSDKTLGGAKLEASSLPSPLLDNNRSSNSSVINMSSAHGSNFGFTIRSSCENGTGIVVSRVRHGSVAEKAGLRTGDKILRLNRTSCQGITLFQASQVNLRLIGLANSVS